MAQTETSPAPAARMPMDVVRRSATSSSSVGFSPNGGELAKLIDVSKCIGCKACQAACIEWNDLRPTVGVNFGSYQNPEDLSPETFTLMRFDEWENDATGRLEWLIRKDGCMHCADPGCLKACPSPGAIVQYSNGIVDFDHEKCIGCGYCVKGCPFNIPRVSKTTEKAYKCTLCSDRIAVGQIPACAKTCPTQAITFGTKEDRLKWADKRVADLKSRGYSEAGIYDPPGVGGTHVFYVLPFADKPSRYSGLPDNPRISPIVEIWKGVARYAGLAVLGLAAVGAAVHHAVAGPNRVSRQDEENAARLKEGAP